MKINKYHIFRKIGICVAIMVLYGPFIGNYAIAEGLQRIGQNFQHVISFEPQEIGDVANHVIASYTHEGLVLVAKGDIGSGEVGTLINKGNLDYVGGLGTHSGYTTVTFEDGSTTTSYYEGKSVQSEKGIISIGIHRYVSGTGRFEGIKGEGSYEGKHFGKMSLMYWKDTIILPY